MLLALSSSLLMHLPSLPGPHISSVGVNYLAHIHLLRAFLPGMLARRSGAVVRPPSPSPSPTPHALPHALTPAPARGRARQVTISSALGIVGASGLTDYCSAKAAVAGLHDALSRELLHQCVLLLPSLTLSPRAVVSS